MPIVLRGLGRAEDWIGALATQGFSREDVSLPILIWDDPSAGAQLGQAWTELTQCLDRQIADMDRAQILTYDARVIFPGNNDNVGLLISEIGNCTPPTYDPCAPDPASVFAPEAPIADAFTAIAAAAAGPWSDETLCPIERIDQMDEFLISTYDELGDPLWRGSTHTSASTTPISAFDGQGCPQPVPCVVDPLSTWMADSDPSQVWAPGPAAPADDCDWAQTNPPEIQILDLDDTCINNYDEVAIADFDAPPTWS